MSIRQAYYRFRARNRIRFRRIGIVPPTRRAV